MESWTRRRTSAQALALRSRIVLLARMGSTTAGRRRLAYHRDTVGEVAVAVSGERLDGLVDEPRPGRPRTISDAQVEEVIARTLETHAQGRHALVDAVDGRRAGLTPDGGARGSGGRSGFSRTASRVQAVQGSAVRRQGLRHRRALSESARARGGAVRGREVPDPGAGPHRADPADAARHARARGRTTTSAHGTTSLYAALDLASGKVIGACTAVIARSSSRVPAAIDARGPRRARRAPGARQQRHAQDTRDPALADRAPPLRPALHADLESWLNLVERWFAELTNKKLRRGTHRSVRAAQHRHPRLDRDLERRTPALRLDQDRRRDPRIDRPLLPAN